MFFHTQHVTVGEKRPKPWFWLYLWFWFGLVWFWICSNHSSEAKNWQKPWFWLYFVLLWFGLALDWFKWYIWGHHWINQLEYVLFDTQHVTIGQKLAQTMVLAIFLVLVLFCWAFDWFKLPIWGYHWISQLEYIIFDTQYVTVGEKRLKPWFWLYLWFWFGLVWFWICSNHSSEATIEFPFRNTCHLKLNIIL